MSGEKENDSEVVNPNQTGGQFGSGRMHSFGTPVEKPKNFGSSAMRLWKLLSKDRLGVFLIATMAVTSVVLVVIGPKILGHATDILFNGLTHRGGVKGVNFDQLHNVLIVAFLVYLVSFLLGYGQTYMLAGVVQRSMFRLRAQVEEKLHRLPLSYIDKTSRGDLLSRVTNDIDNIAQSLQQSLAQLVTSLLTLVGVLVMMFVVSTTLALVALIMVPTSLITIKQIAKRSRIRFIAQWKHTGALNGLVEEAFTGHTIVKAFGKQDEVQRRFVDTNEKLFESSFIAQFMSGIIQPAMMFIGNLNYVAIAVIGGFRVASGTMGLGDVQAFVQYSRQFTTPLTQTAAMVNVLQSGVASAERVFELLDTKEQTPDINNGDPLISPRGHVEFENVSFSYSPDKPLIENLSLEAKPSTTVAIVGLTGAGKTTLVNLLMRFYELDDGRILLDGRDISQMPRRELRSHIGMVLQDTWLFGGTIRENIAYGNSSASEDEIMAAAKATYVDRFVHSLPLGYNTIVDDESGQLSAGEKQLLTIARAFLANPTILILDEATSSVDTRTEVLIQHAMSALRAERTSFVIAHRLSTIRDADVIIVMDNGRVVEQGTHEELITKHGAYFNLYQAQFSAPATEIT